MVLEGAPAATEMGMETELAMAWAMVQVTASAVPAAWEATAPRLQSLSSLSLLEKLDLEMEMDSAEMAWAAQDSAMNSAVQAREEMIVMATAMAWVDQDSGATGTGTEMEDTTTAPAVLARATDLEMVSEALATESVAPEVLVAPEGPHKQSLSSFQVPGLVAQAMVSADLVWVGTDSVVMAMAMAPGTEMAMERVTGWAMASAVLVAAWEDQVSALVIVMAQMDQAVAWATAWASAMGTVVLAMASLLSRPSSSLNQPSPRSSAQADLDT